MSHHIKPIEHFIVDSGEVDRIINEIKRLGRVKQNRSQRVKVIKPIWDRHIATKNDHWFWLSGSLPRVRGCTKTKEHLQRLGLFHYRERKKGDLFLQFQFKIAHKYKPSWLDADLAFYFDAAPDYTENGYTRDLASGLTGLKEWVAFAEHIKLWDVSVLELEEDTRFDVLTDQFLNFHAKRIIAARI